MRERERAEAGLLVREAEVGREREKEPAMGGPGREELLYREERQTGPHKGSCLTRDVE